VHLAREETAAAAQGIGTGSVAEHLEALKGAGVPIFLSGMSSKAREPAEAGMTTTFFAAQHTHKQLRRVMLRVKDGADRGAQITVARSRITIGRSAVNDLVFRIVLRVPSLPVDVVIVEAFKGSLFLFHRDVLRFILITTLPQTPVRPWLTHVYAAMHE
jgi:hypothetical protein